MSLVDNFRASSPNRQLLLVGAAAGMVCLVLVAAYFLLLNKPYATLFNNLRTLDAATIASELDKKKIPYRLENGGSTILVPKDQVDTTRLEIANEDLPIKGMVGFELFNKSDMGLTEFAQRINYQRALQGELARTIMTMASVDTARVHLTLAEPSIFRDDRRPSKASVTVLTRPGFQLSADTITGIQRLIAASVPDLAAGDVVVLDGDGKSVGGETSAGSPAAPQSQEKQAIEDYYAARLRRGLAAVFPGHADVTVEARSDPTPTSIDGSSAALDAWTPAARTFPLTVSIAFPNPPSAQVQALVRTMAAQTVGFDAAKGDSLTLATGDTAPDASPATQTLAARAGSLASDPPGIAMAAKPVGSPPVSLWLGVGVLLIALLASAAYFARHYGIGPRRMSEAQRGEVVRRLRTILEEREAHASPPV
ncbi:MAG TPA: flagellar basal-body MS-ring/collar protein FliF [Caulobacteraceae bacterium]|jgi:flagellar M-ring protein FliF